MVLWGETELVRHSSLYNALLDVLDVKSSYEKIYIVRSLVATREIGFLPGDHEDKSSLYQIPYKNMVKYMFEMPDDNSFWRCYTLISKHKERLVSGPPPSSEEQLSIKRL